MSYPFWITPSALGSFAVSYSFTQTVLTLAFGESNNQPCTVSLLNGQLPTGLLWQVQGYFVVIQGLADVLDTSVFEFTLRASNGISVADRTFTLQLVVPPKPLTFEWITSNEYPLGTVYNGNPIEFPIQAQVDPLQPISYIIEGLETVTQGIIFDPGTGKVLINLSWKPSISYYQEDLGNPPKNPDYVFNNNNLYNCVLSGTSSTSYGPLGTGSNIVDTDYPAWQANSYYDQNRVVYNDLGKIYICLGNGFSDSMGPGPQGTGSNINDGDLNWDYFDQAPLWDYVPANSPSLPLDLLDSNLNKSFAVLPDSLFTEISNFFQIQLINTPAAPIWITPNTQPLVTQIAGSSWDFALEAFDPDQNALTWLITSASPGLPVAISNIGLLYGELPDVSQDTTYSITVAIGDGTTTATRTFTVVATYSEILFEWSLAGNLGGGKDGAISDKFVLAQTLRPEALVTYGLSGGMLPPNIIINQQTGALEGFVEFHAQDKTYYFEITASDGYEEICQQVRWQITSQRLGMHWNLSIPVLGNQRVNLLGLNNSNLIDDDQLYLLNSKGWGRKQTLEIPIISGIRKANDQDLKNLIHEYLHNFRLRLNYFNVSNYEDSEFQIVSVTVQDADTVETWQPEILYEKNKRVSGPDGNRYICVVAGTSGNQAPRGTATTVSDGTVVWSFDSTPLYVNGYYWPLPWYPYHYYLAGQTITNNGNLYKSTTSGYTGGGPGPQQQLSTVQDNQVTWEVIYYPYGFDYNLYWPADVFNLRYFTQQFVGYSNAWGFGAELAATIDSLSGGISSVTVISSGNSYYNVPVVAIEGPGSGCEISLKLGLSQVILVSSTSGFAVGNQFVIDFGTGSPAIVGIASVNLGGVVSAVNIIDPGSFDSLPSGNVTLLSPANNANYIVVRFDAGIEQALVTSPGKGYTADSTVISLQGQEINIAAQQLDRQFNLEMPIGFVKTTQADAVRNKLNTVINPFLGIIVPATLVKATVTGIQWQGHARFDLDTCNFDCDQTRFVDFTPATETVFDQNITWDANYLQQWPDYSQTIFENGQTIFDYYRTLFDARQPVYESRYITSRFWYFGSPFDV